VTLQYLKGGSSLAQTSQNATRLGVCLFTYLSAIPLSFLARMRYDNIPVSMFRQAGRACCGEAGLLGVEHKIWKMI
jgi:hypothetical protein